MLRVELHCHLDGSLNVDFVDSMLRKQGIIIERKELEEKLKVRPDCTSLTEYLEKFALPLLCLQTKEGLEQAAYELVMDAAKDDVAYIEVRFAPMLSTDKGLTCKEVIESVVCGLKKGEEETGVYASAIVCAMRHHSLEQNMEMLQATRPFVGEGVCALDLAGDESAFPTSLFRELFAQAKEWEIPFTIHSGECGSVDNIREAIELGAKRLGHGIALEKSPELRRVCKEKGIGIEMCPTSNLQTKAVENLEKYPLKQFLEEGLLVSVHTDNRTVSGTTMEQEEKLVKDHLQISDEMWLQCTKNAIQTAFASEEIKQQLMEELSWKRN
jgi:adenosine deaminase